MSWYDIFNEQAQEAHQASREIVQRYRHSHIATEHVLLALLEQSDSMVSKILSVLKVETNVLIERLDATLRASPQSNIFGSGEGQIFTSPRVKLLMNNASKIARDFHAMAISTEHIFFAVLTERDTPSARILKSLKITSQLAYKAYQGIQGLAEIPDVTTNQNTSIEKTIPTTSGESPKKLQTLQVFLCHSSGDKPKVRELYQRLLKDGIHPWLDEENLLPGYDWQIEIPKAVHNSDAVIVCLSRGSITKTGYVQKEIKYALDAADEQPEGTIFIIPVKLEECDIPDRLSKWQWVNLFDEKGYQRLIQSLKIRAGKKASVQYMAKSAYRLTAMSRDKAQEDQSKQ